MKRGRVNLHIDYGDEGSVKHGPDDVESPSKGLDADRGDFDDHDCLRISSSFLRR